jgi:hypothetical protein
VNRIPRLLEPRPDQIIKLIIHQDWHSLTACLFAIYTPDLAMCLTAGVRGRRLSPRAFSAGRNGSANSLALARVKGRSNQTIPRGGHLRSSEMSANGMTLLNTSVDYFAGIHLAFLGAGINEVCNGRQ